MIRVFVDLEMNMVSQENTELKAKLPSEIIEIGAVKLDDRFRIVGRFCSYVRPRYNTAVHWSVAKLTGIKVETLHQADYLEQVLPRFVEWLGRDTVLMYAWSDSDHAQMERECSYKQLWTPEIRQAFSHWTDFQRVFTKSVGYRNAISLSKAVEYMGLGFDGTRHDALSDAENCARLLLLMQNKKEYLRRRRAFPPEPAPACKAVAAEKAAEKEQQPLEKQAGKGKGSSSANPAATPGKKGGIPPEQPEAAPKAPGEKSVHKSIRRPHTGSRRGRKSRKKEKAVAAASSGEA